MHINLWQFEGPPSTNQEVVLDDFTFVPEGGPSGLPTDLPRQVTHLSVARPNPFNPSTTITYQLTKGGRATIVVYDVRGRPVRTLVDEFVPVGEHDVMWNGRDDDGNQVASGVYLYQLRTADVVETQRVVLLK